MLHVFDSLSEFCLKKDIINKKIQSEHTFLTDALIKSKDMAATTEICIKQQYTNRINAADIIDNFNKNYNKLPDKFWKTYFRKVTPYIIAQTVKTNDKKTFITFCKQIPLQLIPLRYRIICYILKKTNK